MLFWFKNKMYNLMLLLHLSKELHFQTIPRKGQLFPHEKEEQFSTESKRQGKRKKRKKKIAGESTGNSRRAKTQEQKNSCKKSFSNEQLQLQRAVMSDVSICDFFSSVFKNNMNMYNSPVYPNLIYEFW